MCVCVTVRHPLYGWCVCVTVRLVYLKEKLEKRQVRYRRLRPVNEATSQQVDRLAMQSPFKGDNTTDDGTTWIAKLTKSVGLTRFSHHTDSLRPEQN